MLSRPLITATEITGTYTQNKRQTVHAVQPTSFTIYEGETFGLVGESGCGKSTLGQLLTLLHPISDGTLEYFGADGTLDMGHLKRKQQKQLHREIQIIFQNPFASLNPKKTIGWLLEEPLIIHNIGANRAERDILVDEILDDVGLDSYYKTRYPHELSGGQRQRVAIAIALIVKPRFVVCDEAVSALDVSIQAQVLNLFRALQKKYHLTYLFISHNLNVVSYMADRIGVMYLGRLVEIQTTKNLINAPQHPYTKALFSASVSFDTPQQDRVVLSGELPSRTSLIKGCAFASRCNDATEICKTNAPPLCTLPEGGWVSCHHWQKSI